MIWGALPRRPAERKWLAVVDGASVPDLLDWLDQYRLEHLCLYRGPLNEVLAAKAPYVVAVPYPSAAFRDILHRGWGEHWGIWVEVPHETSIERMQRHFRQFIEVQDHLGNFLYFRFYDPRVLSIYLPTCTQDELALLFGPILRYRCEREGDAAVVSFRLLKQGLDTQVTELGDDLRVSV